jgi:ABC-2 type transport system ATP-binding protein
MIEVENLSKRYGTKLAVDGLNFVVQPGIVTGFLGPNGAGKSTTMRMIAGLDQPTTGRVRVNGGDYRTSAAPMAELGVLLEAKAVHTGRSARNHLLALAQTNGIRARRVDEVIDIVGLQQVAGKRVGGFSLGMGQRLGVASALLGNPQTVVLDVDEFIAQASHHAVTVRTPKQRGCGSYSSARTSPSPPRSPTCCRSRA